MVNFHQYFLSICIFILYSSMCLYTNAQDIKNNVAQCIAENAMQLVGTPYVSGTLETEGQEKLVCINDAFDCVTFVEYVLALSLYQTQDPKQKYTFEEFIIRLRYQNGIIDGYGSRIHYFTAWIMQQEKNNIFNNITKKLPYATSYTKKINFMSAHKASYPNIRDSSSLYRIRQSEYDINQQTWLHIPKGKVKNISRWLRNGDIIAITTTVNGLDIIHTGIAYWTGNDVYLLHASETEKKVTLSKHPLYQYLSGNDKQSGIMVLRCNE